MTRELRIALTGFMGVGKTSVARHLEHITGCRRVDLDMRIEEAQRRPIAEIIDKHGIDAYRAIETETLRGVLESDSGCILSLGGGAWTVEANREMIRRRGFTSVWLESTFEHCWYNIKFSRRDRPLARDKAAARRLFDERQSVYSLADWHFIIRPEFNSFQIARQIVDQLG
jgi:shikimate kinase